MEPFKISKFTVELPMLHPDKTVWAIFNTLTMGFVLTFEPLKKGVKSILDLKFS